MKKHLIYGLLALLTIWAGVVPCGDDEEDSSTTTTTTTTTNNGTKSKYTVAYSNCDRLDLQANIISRRNCSLSTLVAGLSMALSIKELMFITASI